MFFQSWVFSVTLCRHCSSWGYLSFLLLLPCPEWSGLCIRNHLFELPGCPEQMLRIQQSEWHLFWHMPALQLPVRGPFACRYIPDLPFQFPDSWVRFQLAVLEPIIHCKCIFYSHWGHFLPILVRYPLRIHLQHVYQCNCSTHSVLRPQTTLYTHRRNPSPILYSISGTMKSYLPALPRSFQGSWLNHHTFFCNLQYLRCVHVW